MIISINNAPYKFCFSFKDSFFIMFLFSDSSKNLLSLKTDFTVFSLLPLINCVEVHFSVYEAPLCSSFPFIQSVNRSYILLDAI